MLCKLSCHDMCSLSELFYMEWKMASVWRSHPVVLHLIFSSICQMLLHSAFALGPFRTLQWCHNECDGISNHQPHNCLLSCLFVDGIQGWLVNSRHKWPVTRKMFPFDNVNMNSIYSIGKWWLYVTKLSTTAISVVFLFSCCSHKYCMIWMLLNIYMHFSSDVFFLLVNIYCWWHTTNIHIYITKPHRKI